MEMKLLRLTNLSLRYFLKNILYTTVSNEVSTTVDYKTYKCVHSKWLTNKSVSVTKNDAPIDSSLYTINYFYGYITFLDVCNSNDVIKITYSYEYIPMFSSWPDATDFVTPSLIIEYINSDDSPLQLGGGEWVHTLFVLNLFMPNEGARDDVSDLIREYLLRNNAPLVNFNHGFDMLPDGTKNPDFDSLAESIGAISFDKIKVRPNPTGSSDDIEKGRSEIVFEVFSVRE